MIQFLGILLQKKTANINVQKALSVRPLLMTRLSLQKTIVRFILFQTVQYSSEIIFAVSYFSSLHGPNNDDTYKIFKLHPTTTMYICLTVCLLPSWTLNLHSAESSTDSHVATSSCEMRRLTVSTSYGNTPVDINAILVNFGSFDKSLMFSVSHFHFRCLLLYGNVLNR